jgi:hypothetical protein
VRFEISSSAAAQYLPKLDLYPSLCHTTAVSHSEIKLAGPEHSGAPWEQRDLQQMQTQQHKTRQTKPAPTPCRRQQQQLQAQDRAHHQQEQEQQQEVSTRA